MAHFAQLDESNMVIQVIVVNNNDCLLDGVENETVGVMFCKQLFGEDTIWMQTSYNGSRRKNYAGIGFVYDQTRDAFIAPQPEGDGWTLDEELCIWRNLEAERIAEERRLIEEQTRIEVTRV